MNRLFAVAIVLLLSSAQRAIAQTDTSLPTGKELFAKSVEVLGGEDRLKKIETVVVKAEAEVPQLKLTGDVRIYYRKGEMQAVVNFSGVKTIQGVTGGRGWELSPTGGPRLMSDLETRQLIDSVTMGNYVDPDSFYKSIESAGKQLVGSEECYQVDAIRKQDGELERIFFSIRSGLPVKTITRKTTEVGNVEIVTVMGDYKSFDQIKSAGRLSTSIEKLKTTYNMILRSVTYNKPVEDAVFDLPDQIKPLLAK